MKTLLTALMLCCLLAPAQERRRLIKSHGTGYFNGASGSSWVPTNTYQWLDLADSAKVILTNSSTQIAALIDKSGNGFNATVAQLSTAPTNATISGRKFAHFVTSVGSDFTHTCVLTGNSSAFLVARVNETTAQRGIMFFSGAADVAFVWFFANTGSSTTATNWGPYINGYKVASYRDDSFHVFGMSADANTATSCTNKLYTDFNAEEIVSGTSRAASSVANKIGSNPFSGATTSMDFGEVLAYNRVLGATERSNVIYYLQQKWGTP